MYHSHCNKVLKLQESRIKKRTPGLPVEEECCSPPKRKVTCSMIPLYMIETNVLHKDIFACLFSIHNTISLSCHEQVCLNILVHDMINLLYYEY